MVLVVLIAGVFLWSVKNGQFDDLEEQGQRILFDDDRTYSAQKNNKKLPIGEVKNI